MIIIYIQVSSFSTLPRTAIAFTQGQHFVRARVDNRTTSLKVQSVSYSFSTGHPSTTRDDDISYLVSIIIEEVMFLIHNVVSCPILLIVNFLIMI